MKRTYRADYMPTGGVVKRETTGLPKGCHGWLSADGILHDGRVCPVHDVEPRYYVEPADVAEQRAQDAEDASEWERL